MPAPAFAPLYHLREAECWPSLASRQAIPPFLASAGRSGSKVGLGLVKAACRLLTRDRVTGLGWDAARSCWSLAYQGESGAYTFSGTASCWQVAHATSYHLALAGLVDALVRGCDLPATAEVRARWLAFLDRLRVLAGPPPYDTARLRECARDQEATDALMAVTDALYFLMKAQAAEGLQIEEASQASAAMPAPLVWLVPLLWEPPSPPSEPPPVLRPARRLFTLEDFLP
jgi:hypothetical protein